MAKIISTPKTDLSTWKARVTCGNPLCRAILEVDESDLYLAVSGVSGPGSAGPVFDHKIAVICPACQHQWFLSDEDAGKVPGAIARRLRKRSVSR